MRPIKVDTTKMPHKVTANITTRKAQPLSPPTLPVSTVRIVASQKASTKLKPS